MKRRNRLYLALFVLLTIAVFVVVVMQGGGMTAETYRVQSQELEVTVRGEGMTRVIDRYVMTAPVSGQLQRISLLPGDEVEAGVSLFRISIPMETRQSRQVAEARLEAASARVQQIDGQLVEAREIVEQAERDLARMISLAEQDIVAPAELEQVERNASSPFYASMY